MALMFPRLARNFARNGYYPTDEITLERTLQALAPSSTGRMRILDPCAGEGAALAEAAHMLGREQVDAFAVEYDSQRADHARKLLDRVLHSDLMDTMISRQSFGLLWLNPPYGDLVSDQAGTSQYQGTGWKSCSTNEPCPSSSTAECWFLSFHTMSWTMSCVGGCAITSPSCASMRPRTRPSSKL